MPHCRPSISVSTRCAARGGLVRREAPGGQGVEGADEGHGDRGRGAGAGAGRRLGVDRDLEPQVARDLHVGDRGLEEGVGPPGRRLVPHVVPRRRSSRRGGRAAVRRVAGGVDRDLDLRVGVDRDVEDLAVAREPGVGPAPVVADADRGHAVDDGEGALGRLHGHGAPGPRSLVRHPRALNEPRSGMLRADGVLAGAGGGARVAANLRVLHRRGARGAALGAAANRPEREAPERGSPRRPLRPLPRRAVAAARRAEPAAVLVAPRRARGHRPRAAAARVRHPRPRRAPLPGDHPGGRALPRPPAARRHDRPCRPLGRSSVVRLEEAGAFADAVHAAASAGCPSWT